MVYTESITEIKKAASRIKTMLDKADSSLPHSTLAITNAATQLTRIQGELKLIERTLKQFAVSTPVVKIGPTETKSGK